MDVPRLLGAHALRAQPPLPPDDLPLRPATLLCEGSPSPVGRHPAPASAIPRALRTPGVAGRRTLPAHDGTPVGGRDPLALGGRPPPRRRPARTAPAFPPARGKAAD